MMAINALIKGANIVIFATPDDIEREREALQRWRDEEWDEIPRRYNLAKALLAGDRDALRKAADLLAKATPAERLDAQIIADSLKAEYGIAAAE